MLPLLASAIPALAGLVAGPAAAAFGIGSAVKQAADNPGSQTWLGSATDELFNGGANRINLAESQAARAQQHAQFEQNMAFQREQFDYQKQLNDLQIQREDTAAQRQVADMRAAGISPLAQFSGASTGSLSGSGFSGSSASPVAGSASPLSLISGVAEIAQMIQSLQMNKAQISKTNAETAGILGDNQFTTETYNDRVMLQRLLKIRNQADLDNYLRDFNYKNHLGIVDSMSDTEKTIRTILGSLNYNLKSGHDLSSYGDSLNYEYYDGSDPRLGEYENKLDAKTILDNIITAFGASDKSKSMFLKTPLGEFLTKLLGITL